MKYTPKDGFPYYFELVKQRDCRALFESLQTFQFLETIDEEKANHRYATDKWSLKEVVGHITDHERIKMYRAFLLSRRQPVQLWGYDQVALVQNGHFNERTLKQLVDEFQMVRTASRHFVASLSQNQMNLKAQANQYEITLEDFLKSIIGHEKHHINILKGRYF